MIVMVFVRGLSLSSHVTRISTIANESPIYGIYMFPHQAKRRCHLAKAHIGMKRNRNSIFCSCLLVIFPIVTPI